MYIHVNYKLTKTNDIYKLYNYQYYKHKVSITVFKQTQHTNKQTIT